MTHALIKSCRKKSKLKKMYKKFPNAINRIKYKNYKKTLRSCIITAEKNYHQQQLKEMTHDMRKTWKVINNIINKNNCQMSNIILKLDNVIVDDPKIIVEKFNSFFVDIGPKLASNIQGSKKLFTDFLPPSSQNSMALHLTDKYEVLNIINGLKNKTSFGLDEIPINIIKFAKDFIAQPLSDLINCSFNTGIFPNNLKQAKVIPVFKSGDCSQLTNYRPISLLNSFSKIYEKVIAERLLKFLDKDNFFYPEQFGFRKNHSTQAALINFHEFISNSVEKNEIPIAIFLDMSKAFDTLDHNILFKKLEHVGIRGNMLELIKSYLTQRTQCVHYKFTLSSQQFIKCGVPQGSILGPLLFLIYINDIHRSSFLLKFILFADDTTLLFSSKSLQHINQIISNELQTVSEWIRANKLSLNVSKTNFMIFKKFSIAKNSLQISIDKNVITQTASTKFLGLEINSELNWTNHISLITKKIARAIGVIRRVRYKLTKAASMLLYDTLIVSHINYCNILWASNYKTTLSKIYSLQKRALKLCQGIKSYIPYFKQGPNNHNTLQKGQSIFHSNSKLSVYEINKCQIASFTYKTLNNLSPLCFKAFFTQISNVHSHNTRAESRNDLFTKPAKTNSRKFAISVRAPVIWNDIPITIRNSSSVSQFSINLKKFYVNSFVN